MARLNAKFPLGAALSGLSMFFAPVATAAQTSFQLPSLAKFLDEHNWLALPIPDPKMGPGAVIQVTKIDGAVVDVRWLGDLRKCGIKDSDLGLVRGKFPMVSVGETFSVQASGLLNLLSRFGGGIEAKKVDGAILKIDDSGGDGLDFLAFSTWLEKPSNRKKIPTACRKILEQENVYIVSEAFRVSKASYELVDKNGAKLNVSAQPLGHSANAQADVALGSSGTIEVTEDFYFGIRKVKEVAAKGGGGGGGGGGGLMTLELARGHAHPDGHALADDELREYFKHNSKFNFEQDR